MATYTFETITAEQALAFTSADQLVFSTPGATARAVVVAYKFVGDPDTVDLTFGGRTVTFGVGIFGASDFTFSDSSRLFVGDPAGAETYSGGASDDLLYGSEDYNEPAGADSIDGGGGADDITITNGTARGGDGNDTLSGVFQGSSTLFGDAGDDLITVEGRHVVSGGDGADRLSVWNWGDATISGDAGDDWIDIGEDGGRAYGGEGNDTISGGRHDAMLYGGVGKDRLNPSFGATAYGGDDDDYISGSPASAYGEAGNDTIFGGDSVFGGAGDDVISPHYSTKQVFGEAGNDTIYWWGNSQTISGGDGDDLITSFQGYFGPGLDLDGGAGNDTIASGFGSDTISGGSGIDTVTFVVAGGGFNGGGVSASLLSSSAQIEEWGVDSITGFENIIGGSHNDSLVGDDQDNILKGLDGSDTLVGGGGSDELWGGTGRNRIDGGSGIDVLVYSDRTTGVSVDLAAGLSGVSGGETVVGVEQIVGSGHADSVLGDGADNTLMGADGDDLLDGRSGDDVLDGGAGADTVAYANATGGISVSLLVAGPQDAGGAQGVDTLVSIENVIGSAFNDTLIGDSKANGLNGGAGTDSLHGGGGDDSLHGGAGADTLAGDAGVDLASYEAADSGVTVSLADSARNTGDAAGDIYSGIEGIIGSSHNDNLYGDAGANRLHGGFGNDSLFGGAGADYLNGWAGFNYACYNDQAYAGFVVSLKDPGRNTGVAAGDILVSIPGIVASYGDDSVYGDYQDNHFYGLTGDDHLFGDVGNDHLFGGAGADHLDGGEGFDYARYDDEDYAGFTVSLADPSRNTGVAAGDILVQIDGIRASSGADWIYGDAAANSLYGEAGHDNMFGGAGADYLNGGAGFDYARYDDQAHAGFTVSLAESWRNTGAAAGDFYIQIEGIIASSGSDWIYGDAGGNYLYGLAGHDNLSGGAGADHLDGGDGFDYARYDDQVYAGFVVSLADSSRNTGVAAGDTLVNIEGIVASYGADTVYGDAGSNYLYGLAGNDYLFGGAGADHLDGGQGLDYARYDDQAYAGFTVSLANPARNTGAAAGDTLVQIEGVVASSGNDWIYGDGGANYLYGMAGHDNLLGGAGADYLHGGAGFDYARYDDQSYAGFVVSLADPARNTGVAAGDVLVQIEGLVASSGGDSLYGDAGSNYLYGMAGADYLYGGAGADHLDGGTGFDYARYDDQTYAGFTLSLVNPAASTGPAAGDVFVQLEGFVLGSGGDSFVGDDASHYVYGLAGADTLAGGGGQDFLYGGVGADRFVYARLSDSTVAAPDRIGDYSAAAGDVLDLSAIDADSAAAGDQAFSLVASFSGVAGQAVLTYDAGAGVTRLTLDVNGDSAADFAVVLSGQVTGVAGWAL